MKERKVTPGCDKSGKNYELLLDYCAGKLDVDQTVMLERHLSVCPECAQVSKSLHSVWEALDQWHAPEVSADFDRRLYARIEQQGTLPSYRQWLNQICDLLFRPAVPLGIAAGLLVLTAIRHQPVPTSVPLSAPAAVNQSAEVTFSETEADQMEKTLDDLEMLHQFDAHPEEPEKLSNSM
jgi:anti-sigma factor RsiW